MVKKLLLCLSVVALLSFAIPDDADAFFGRRRGRGVRVRAPFVDVQFRSQGFARNRTVFRSRNLNSGFIIRDFRDPIIICGPGGCRTFFR